MQIELKETSWNQDPNKRDLKPVSVSTLRKFGLKLQDIKYVGSLEELRKYPPNIVIAQSQKTFNFTQNFFKEQSLKKKVKYVMGLGVFQQLYHNETNRKVKLLKPTSMRFKNMYKPYLGQEADDKTILVFRTGGIGDLLFIQPNLIYLKHKYPTCYIKFACGPQYQSMVNTWDCVDEVLDLPFSFKHLQESDYHMLFEGVIERCKEAETQNSYNLFSTWLGLDLPNNLLIPKQYPDEDLVDKCFDRLKKWNLEDKSFILMQIRASSPIRTPSHEFWIRIIDELNKRGHYVIITDGPSQSKNIDIVIMKHIKNPDMTFNFAHHSESIGHTIALTSLCKSTFSTDSALGHIAASLGKKCFGIYGPFPGHIRLKTYPNAAWIDAKRHCAPCFMHSQEACPQAQDGYSPCYNELIETEEKLKDVIDKFEEFIEQ